VGPYKNGGQEWQPQGQPEHVNVYDFVDKRVGKAIPYGVYDVGRNAGWVNVGQDHDTAQFAVESLRRWWRMVGQTAYPQADRLLICADGGGSNGTRVRLWKVALHPASLPPLSAAAVKPVVGRTPPRPTTIHRPPRQHPPLVVDGTPTRAHPWRDTTHSIANPATTKQAV